jgi:hypothetical protein
MLAPTVSGNNEARAQPRSRCGQVNLCHGRFTTGRDAIISKSLTGEKWPSLTTSAEQQPGSLGDF